jgi:hypothetical protein
MLKPGMINRIFAILCCASFVIYVLVSKTIRYFIAHLTR